MWSLLRQILGTVVLAVAIFFLLSITVQSSIVVGNSMEPGIKDGQWLIINKAVYAFHEPERGDIIVFQPPYNWHDDYIKRIIALPGEAIEIKEKVVYVNGSPLDEPYIIDAPDYTLSQYRIPDGSYFVLGDNRNVSSDSHNGWTVPRQNIVGKAWLSVWPLNEWEFVPNFSLP